MIDMLAWIGEATLVAAVLAAVVAVVGRSRWVSAEVRHALWVVVLVKFLLPPVVTWPRLAADFQPGSAPVIASISQPAPLPVPGRIVAPDLVGPAPPPTALLPAEVPTTSAPVVPLGPVVTTPALVLPRVAAIRPALPVPPAPVRTGPAHAGVVRVDGSALLLTAWLIGTVGVVAVGVVRVARFRRVMAGGTVAPAALVAEVAEVAARFGVRGPAVLVVPGVPTPLLWCLGRPLLVVPVGMDQLTSAQRVGLIAHELAHLSRLDHWVVRLELLAGLVWWWNPVFRLARRRLRDEAELACDARVIRAFPEHRFAYAEALVEVCARQAPARPVPPLPALGVGGPRAARTLEARLTMILRGPVRPPSRWTPLLALTMLALVLPTWSRGQQPPDPPPNPSVAPADPTRAAGSASAPAPTPPVADLPASAPLFPQPILAAGVALPPADPVAEPWTIERINRERKIQRWPDQPLTYRSAASTRWRTRGSQDLVEVQVADVTIGRRSEFHPEVPIPAAPPSSPIPARTALEGPEVDDGPPSVASTDRFSLGQLDRVEIVVARHHAVSRPEPVLGSLPRWNRRVVERSGPDVETFVTNNPLIGLIPPDLAPIVTSPERVEADLIPVRWYPNDPTDDLNHDDNLSPLLLNLPASPRMPIDAWVPRPEHLLDLAGPASLVFNNPAVQTVLGQVESIQGIEVVPVAWVATGPNATPQPHGVCWVAPALGFALVRFEAVASLPDGQGASRQTWRKEASGFRPVGPVWLPTVIRSRTTRWSDEWPTTESNEVAVALEDYQFQPTATPNLLPFDTSNKPHGMTTGELLMKPPAIPASLTDRLRRAIAESPFGPPGGGGPAATAPSAASAPAPAASARAADPEWNLGENLELAVKQALRDVAATASQKRAPQVGSDAMLADASVERLPQANQEPAVAHQDVAPPAPAAAPRQEPAAEVRLLVTRRTAQEAEVARAEAIRDRADLDLANTKNLFGRKGVSKREVDRARLDLKIAETGFDREKAKLAEANELVDQARSQANPAPTSPAGRPRTAPGNESAVLQARRAAQAAEVQRYEALLQMAAAVISRNDNLNKRTNGTVSREEQQIAEAQYMTTKFELAREKARLVEADALLAQGPSTVPPQADTPTAGSPTPLTLADWRDQLEMAELQLEGKETKYGRLRWQRANDDHVTGDDLVAADFGLQEAKLRVKQARTRVEAETVRLQRQADRLRAQLEWSRKMAARGYVNQSQVAAERERYDDLRLQIDQSYKPEPESGELVKPPEPASLPQ